MSSTSSSTVTLASLGMTCVMMVCISASYMSFQSAIAGYIYYVRKNGHLFDSSEEDAADTEAV
jgi:hypothetical protein